MNYGVFNSGFAKNMNKKNNIGNWTAKVNNDGKAPQIIITGTFPTNGEKPLYHLIKNEPQGINPEELVLTLVFGFLVSPTGSVNQTAVFTEVINTAEQYKSVLIIDDSEKKRTLANLIFSDVQTFVDNEKEYAENYIPHLEILLGIEITSTKLKIRAYTGGCTTKDSFQININKGFTGLPPYIVEVYRIEPDYCKGFFPEGILLEYDLSILGIEPFSTFSVRNTIGRI